jgi:hypothetical protein
MPAVQQDQRGAGAECAPAHDASFMFDQMAFCDTVETCDKFQFSASFHRVFR